MGAGMVRYVTVDSAFCSVTTVANPPLKTRRGGTSKQSLHGIPSVPPSPPALPLQPSLKQPSLSPPPWLPPRGRPTRRLLVASSSRNALPKPSPSPPAPQICQDLALALPLPGGALSRFAASPCSALPRALVPPFTDGAGSRVSSSARREPLLPTAVWSKVVTNASQRASVSIPAALATPGGRSKDRSRHLDRDEFSCLGKGGETAPPGGKKTRQSIGDWPWEGSHDDALPPAITITVEVPQDLRSYGMTTFEAEIYRKSTIGMCLMETLDEMVTSGVLSPEQAMQVLVRFDKSIVEALESQVRSKVSIKGHLHTYRYCENMWTFILQDALFQNEERREDLGHVKIVAFDSKLKQ